MIPRPKDCIAFVSAHKATNVLNWSGTLSSLLQSLEARSTVAPVVALDGGWLSEAFNQLNRILYFVGIRFDARLTTLYAVLAGIYISCRLMHLPRGPVVAAAASNYVPYLLTRRTIVHISDATFAAAADLYPEMKSLPAWLSRQCQRHEALTLKRATYVILPSQWAATSAEIDYGVKPEKIFVLPFGANIPGDVIDRYYVSKSIAGQSLRLLFVSADWIRKGGDKAIEICSVLRRLGVDAQLTIVGRAPKQVLELPFVEYLGFLRKDNPEELAQLCTAFQRAHFFLLPTLGDASPIVFPEAQAFGVPPITHEIGGTGSSIIDGVTGLLSPTTAPPEEFAQRILRYVKEPAAYEELSKGCRTWFLNNAQWSRWSELVHRLCKVPE